MPPGAFRRPSVASHSLVSLRAANRCASATCRAVSVAPASAGEIRRRRRTCDSPPCVADAIGDAGMAHVDVATVPADDEAECHHLRRMNSALPGERRPREPSPAVPGRCRRRRGRTRTTTDHNEPGPLGSGAPRPNGARNHTSLCPATTRSTDDVSSKCVNDDEGAALMMIMTCRSPPRRRKAGGRPTTPAGTVAAVCKYSGVSPAPPRGPVTGNNGGPWLGG